MFLFGIVMAIIGIITLVISSSGIDFFVVGAIAELLNISEAMFSTLLIVIGVAMVLVRAALGLVRVFSSRISSKGQKEEQS